MTQMRVPFGDLGRQFRTMQEPLEAAALRVLRSGWYVLGAEVRAFEEAWAAFCGAPHCVGVANGSDALHLALRAVGVGAGDEVITVPNAAGYTAFAVRLIGARPVYADVDPATFVMDPRSVESLITERTRAIVPVHLYGAPAPMRALAEIAQRRGVPLVEDGAQAHGAIAEGKPVGAWSGIATFSFYPTKNLGGLGDGGAIVVHDDTLHERVRRLRQYGWAPRYNAVEPYGLNSRLDELQAALLGVRLTSLSADNERRRTIAARYNAALRDVPGIVVPTDSEGHVHHLYVLRVLDGGRDALRHALLDGGVGCDVHYPVPDYLQPAFAHLGYGAGTAPVAEQLAREVLSLPCYPELRDDEVDIVVGAVREAMCR
jgi:dTDP-4-amino-4,6-dideoxygalactose transaminase